MDKIQQLQQFVDESSYIVFFGGAGVSTESGIPDFRSTDGLYHMKYHYPPEQIISRSFFEKDPEEFYRFYRDKMLWPEAQPNPAHEKLAQLEQEGKLKAVITQNIDGLHQMAGSRRVLELHGTVHRNYCQKCGRLFGMSDILRSEGVPHCPCGGVIKPAGTISPHWRGRSQARSTLSVRAESMPANSPTAGCRRPSPSSTKRLPSRTDWSTAR